MVEQHDAGRSTELGGRKLHGNGNGCQRVYGDCYDNDNATKRLKLELHPGKCGLFWKQYRLD
jgi:hypothetical protein